MESNLDTTIDDDRYICQYETNTLTIESPSLAQFSHENIAMIIDHSNDEPLLSIPPIVPNSRKDCTRYWLEILTCSIILAFVTMIIVAGILFMRISATSPSQLPGIGCNKQSATGKSCSTNGLKSIVLVSLENSPSKTYLPFSFAYTAPSNRIIITFSFAKNSDFYLDDLSIFDSLSNVELIEDGGFENGTLYAYCVCDSSYRLTEPVKSHSHSGVYGCNVRSFSSIIQLSQAVNTIAGRNYNISFWLQANNPWENHVTVYTSAGFSTGDHSIFLLLFCLFSTLFKSLSLIYCFKI